MWISFSYFCVSFKKKKGQIYLTWTELKQNVLGEDW